jgi:hypothetical protein
VFLRQPPMACHAVSARQASAQHQLWGPGGCGTALWQPRRESRNHETWRRLSAPLAAPYFKWPPPSRPRAAVAISIMLQAPDQPPRRRRGRPCTGRLRPWLLILVDRRPPRSLEAAHVDHQAAHRGSAGSAICLFVSLFFSFSRLRSIAGRS